MDVDMDVKMSKKFVYFRIYTIERIRDAARREIERIEGVEKSSNIIFQRKLRHPHGGICGGIVMVKPPIPSLPQLMTF